MVAARTLHINPALLGVSALWHLVSPSLFRCLDDLGANYSLAPSGRVHVLLFLGWSMAALFILLYPIPSFGLENPSVLISEQGLGHKHCSDISYSQLRELSAGSPVPPH